MYDRKDTSQLPSTSWGHVEVVHYTMLFLVSLAHSYADVVQPVLCNCHNLNHWLKRLTLESPEVCKLMCWLSDCMTDVVVILVLMAVVVVVSSVTSRQHLRSASQGFLVMPGHHLSSYGR